MIPKSRWCGDLGLPKRPTRTSKKGMINCMELLSPTVRNDFERRLRANLQSKSEELVELLKTRRGHWGYEDPVYRFYHQSWKVFYLQEETQKIVAMLQSLLPDRPSNSWFAQIVSEGTGKQFKPGDNQNWPAVTRPLVEAFFHAHYFLDMACRYREPPPEDQNIPSGWAALLYLFDIR